MVTFLLKALREQRGISKTEMAKLTCMSIASYMRKESGVTPFRTTEIKAIQKILGLKESAIYDIFFRTEEEGLREWIA